MIEICETLDGLPLGIELAAARMAAMSAVEVRDRLGDRFRLLTGPEYGPDRQLTLRHAVAWSYDLLDDDERAVLRTASVFAGGFDLPALCAVAEASDDVEVLRLLDSLVRKSLVVAHHGAARTRYSLFETIRAFADERLAETGERDAACATGTPRTSPSEAAARWERWNGPGWRDQVDWVQAELANLRSAFRWSVDRGQVEVATDVAAHAALMGFSVELFETIGWAEALLDAAARADVRRLPRLYAAAGYACFVGRAAAATANAHRATELEGRPGYESCEPGYATFIEALGQVYCGNLDRYVELTREVAALPGTEPGVRRSPRTSTACSRRAGSRRRWSSPSRRSRRRASSATRTGSPTRCGSSGWPSRRRTRSARWRPGTRASRTSASTTSGSSRASWPATPRSCTPRTASWRRP